MGVVSYQGSRIHPYQTGFITKYSCLDTQCVFCNNMIDRHPAHFNLCLDDDPVASEFFSNCNNYGLSQKYHCFGGNVWIRFYDNQHCHGEPINEVTSDDCFHDGSSAMRFGCYFWEPDLRISTEDKNDQLDVNIAVALLSIVCIIGIIVGY